MESTSPKTQAQLQRSLASVKIVSRLLSHELHAQAASKMVTLSRDEVIEIQTVIDVFIEEVTRRQNVSTTTAAEPTLVSRN